MKLSALLKTIQVKHTHFIGPACNEIAGSRIKPEYDTSSAIQSSFLPDTDIGSIHYRAQQVEPGGLFVAVPGQRADGYNFIGQALKRGAKVIVSQRSGDEWRQKPYHETEGGEGFTYIEVENVRKTLADISAVFYDNPSGKVVMIGITGTKGKTTTAQLIESVLLQTGEGIHPGVIGTHNYRYNGKTFDNPLTTPEAPELQKILMDMANTGISHVVMEVSSIGIDQYRVDHCWFDVGVFTNLSQDHLDYHGTMEAYWSCKKKWFTDHLRRGPKKKRAKAVINCDHVKGRELYSILTDTTFNLPVISVGLHQKYSVWADDLLFDLTGISGRLSTPRGSFHFKTSLVGKYNLENILCAAGAGEALELPLSSIKKGIESVPPVSGRLEFIQNDYHRFIYVDFAHSPDAMERVLSTLRNLTSGRIICVFGCGGDRDKGKRPLMGEIAARFCDLSIVTSDNPRAEDPGQIIDQICRGMKKTFLEYYSSTGITNGFYDKGYTVEPDRKRAIRLSIAVSSVGDVIVIMGKGDETYQIIGEKVIPFDDRLEVKKALSTGLIR